MTEAIDGEATLMTKLIQKEKMKTLTDASLQSQRAMSGKQELLWTHTLVGNPHFLNLHFLFTNKYLVFFVWLTGTRNNKKRHGKKEDTDIFLVLSAPYKRWYLNSLVS